MQSYQKGTSAVKGSIVSVKVDGTLTIEGGPGAEYIAASGPNSIFRGNSGFTAFRRVPG